MMLLLYLTILVGETLGTNEECPGEIATTYVKEILQSNFREPREFALDKAFNTLYFTHGKDLQLGKINLGTKKYKDVQNFQSNSQTVNQETHELYMSMENGILKYDARRFTTEFVPETFSRRLVNSIYFNKDLYYTEVLSGLAYKITDSRDVMVNIGTGKVDRFVIDGNGTCVFINQTGLYSVDENNVIVPYLGIKHIALTTDNNGKVLTCSEYGVFHVNNEKHVLENVVTHMTSGCTGVAIDKHNNIIFSDGDAIIRLNFQKKCIEID